MKNTSKFILFSSSVMFVLTVLFGFTKKKHQVDDGVASGTYVTMMTVEVHGKNTGGSEIEICYGSEKVDHIQLNEYSKDNRESNLTIITNALNKLKKEGYSLISTSVAVTDYHKTELFVFQKD